MTEAIEAEEDEDDDDDDPLLELLTDCVTSVPRTYYSHKP